MSERKKSPGEDDGVVSSASPAAGNLLSDLLSSVKADVAQERQQRVESEAQRREREARETREREEGRLRMAAQEKLNQEARLRNESLNKARAEAGEARDDVVTGQHRRPATGVSAHVVVPAAVVPEAPEPPARRGASWALVAALSLIGAGLGFGGALASQPEPRGVFVDVGSAAKATISVAGKAAAIELEAKKKLEEKSNLVTELEKSVKDANDAKQKLEAENAALKAAPASAPKPVAPAAPARRPSGGGGGGSGGLSIRSGIF
jgi:hypothetical protein